MNATVEISQDQKRIKIAESCGWEITCDDSDNAAGRIYGKRNGRETQIPNYFGSLDAVHEVEKTLSNDAYWSFLGELQTVCESLLVGCVSAEAEQRAEAFGKTLNLW